MRSLDMTRWPDTPDQHWCPDCGKCWKPRSEPCRLCKIDAATPQEKENNRMSNRPTTFTATAYPWAKRSDTDIDWGAKVKAEDNGGHLPQPGDTVTVTSKGGKSWDKAILEVRTFKDGDACVVRTGKLPEDPGSKPLPFGDPEDPLPWEKPEHPDAGTTPNDGVAELAARLDKAAGVIKMMAGRMKELETQVARHQKQLDALGAAATDRLLAGEPI